MINKFCNICKKSINSYYYSNSTNFLYCSYCDAVSRYPMPSLFELEAIYAESYSTSNVLTGETNQESGSYANNQYSQFIDQIIPNIDTINILDYGCGTGGLIKIFDSRGIRVSGYDFSINAQEFLDENNSMRVLRSLTEVSNNKFDLILMIEVIEHLLVPVNSLFELNQCLTSNGKLFITTPNRLGWRARISGSNWREAQKKFHLYLFSEKSLRNLLENNGFKNIKRIRFSPITRPGIKYYIWGRFMQLIGFGGTLCMTAEK